MRHIKFHLFMTVLAVAGAALCAWGLHAARMSVPPAQLLPRLALLGLLLGAAAFYRWRRLEKPVNLILMTFWAVFFSNLLLLPMYVAARQRPELCDALLARADAALGVEVPDVLRLVDRFPAVAGALAFVYGTLIFLMTMAVMLPPLFGRMDKAKEYALACLAAAAISMPIFAAFQALGPWSYYGYAPSPHQAESMRTFLALKTDGPIELDLSDLNGLICFPSFHTILAVLAAAALWPFPYLRWFAAVLAGLIVVSTVTTGWHYLADVAGGLLVAPASLALARGYLWLEPRVGWPGGGAPSGEKARFAECSRGGKDADNAREVVGPGHEDFREKRR
jgi:hypothetical protein